MVLIRPIRNERLLFEGALLDVGIMQWVKFFCWFQMTIPVNSVEAKEVVLLAK